MKKKHDIVETSKMSAEYNGALIDVERVAGADLDNGRIAVRDGNQYVYAKDATVEDVFLITTPEKMYEDLSLTEFYNKKGSKVRAERIMKGDIFGTTSIDGAKIGDKVITGAAGKLVKGTTGEAIFEVVDVRSIGGFPLTVVERIK